MDGLLFWTDNYNPPRFLNTLRNYDSPSGTPLVDGDGDAALFFESLLVIKKPPQNAPTVEMTTTSGGDENYSYLEYCGNRGSHRSIHGSHDGDGLGLLYVG